MIVPSLRDRRSGGGRRWLIGGLALGAGVGLVRLLLSAVYGLSPYDEGLVVFNAQRILDGDTPYRDFWTMYAPGQFYGLAALFHLFGSSLTVARVAGLAFKLATVALLGVTVGRWTHRRDAALACVAIMVIAGNVLPNLASPVIVAVALGALATAILAPDVDRGIGVGVAAGGALVAATAFRHDLGAFAAIGHAAGLLLAGRSRRTVAALVVTYAAGVALLGAAVVALSGHRDVVQQLVLFPLRDYAEQRRLPWPRPSLHAWGIYFPFLMALPLLRFGRGGDARRSSVWIPGCVMIAFLGASLVRTDREHAYPSLLYAIVLFIVLSTRPTPPSKILVVLGIVAALGGVRLVKDDGKQAYRWVASDACRPIGLERAGRTRLCDEAPGLAETVAFLERHGGAAPRIFVGNPPHDRAYINDVMLYFLSGATGATRYHELHPGVSNTRDAQSEMIERWRDAPPDFVVLRTFTSDEPNGSVRTTGVTLVDDFIAEHYAVTARFGAYTILEPG